MPDVPLGHGSSRDGPGSTVAAGDLERDAMIGRMVGSYRIAKLLGEGGMGAVYLGEHPAIGSKVAIKMLHAQYAAKPTIVERFFNEARSVNLIGHDNIVKILDFDVTGEGRHYFVMEFLHGRALQALLQPGRPLPLQLAGPILLQCCRALQAAHERGIVHRDFKPDNVFLVEQAGRQDVVKLVDFGIAKLAAESGGGMTQPGTVMGTPAYMSPEQAAGEATIDARSDIYSLGVTMFQMATGKLPFAEAGPSFGKILIAHLQQPPPLPRSIEPGVPEELERIILRTLEKKPEDRYPSMTGLHDALRACMDELGLSPEPPLAGEAGPPPGAGRSASKAPPSLASVTPALGSTAARTRLLGEHAQRRSPARTILLAGGAIVAVILAAVLAPRWLARPGEPARREPPPPPAKIEPRASESETAPGSEAGTSNPDQQPKRQEPPPPSPPPLRAVAKPAREPREASRNPAVAVASSAPGAGAVAAVPSVFFQCAGAREVCGALRTAVDEALDKAGLRSVRNAAKADIGVEARVTSLGENVARSFETALAVQTYSIDLTAETTGTAEVVSMPPSTTVSYDPRFGSERVVEKARLVAGEVVERVQAFASKRRR
ncbi:MAG TPA: serine/threonine-protein kinase [Myxococcales bacterium]